MALCKGENQTALLRSGVSTLKPRRIATPPSALRVPTVLHSRVVLPALPTQVSTPDPAARPTRRRRTHHATRARQNDPDGDENSAERMSAECETVSYATQPLTQPSACARRCAALTNSRTAVLLSLLFPPPCPASTPTRPPTPRRSIRKRDHQPDRGQSTEREMQRVRQCAHTMRSELRCAVR